jgi:glycosyltransferase involved in cell wall biosynthesis
MNKISFVHLDTADRRGLANINRIDVTNVVLAGLHCVKYLWLLLAKGPVVVYLPIAQNRLGFLRDCLFLIPARILKKKLVVHLHAGGFANFYQGSSSIMQKLISFALRKVDRAIVLGSSLVQTFQEIIPAERVVVIPNGAEDHNPETGNKTRNGRTIVFLSTLMKEKGTLDVLESLANVAERVPDLQMVFAGEWFRQSDREIAENTVRRMRLDSQVKFLGPVAAPFKYELLNAADVFVLPSYNEGQPFAILEAMAASLPVISTRVGCIPDTVIDGVNGFLLEPGDVNTLAEKLMLLLIDDDLRQRMSDASRKRFLSNYTLESFATHLNALFAGLLPSRNEESTRELLA